MVGHGEKYSLKKDEAILALLSHSSIPDAAKAIGVVEKTLWRWMQRDDFQENYQKAKRENIKRVTACLQAVMGVAINTLRNVMEDDSTPASAKVSAAKVILDMGNKAIEAEEIDDRLKKLEEHVAGKGAA